MKKTIIALLGIMLIGIGVGIRNNNFLGTARAATLKGQLEIATTTFAADFTSPTKNVASVDFVDLKVIPITADYEDTTFWLNVKMEYNKGGQNWFDGPSCTFFGGHYVGMFGEVNPPWDCSGTVPVGGVKFRVRVTAPRSYTASAIYSAF